MRRICVTTELTNMADEYKRFVLSSPHIDEVLISPVKRLKALKMSFDEGRVQECTGVDREGKDVIEPLADNNLFARYVGEIITFLTNNLLTVKPSEIDGVIRHFEEILLPPRLKAVLKVGNNGKKKFWEIIERRMMYKEIRRLVFPQYIKRQGLKSCVYCNANYIITDNNGIAYYDLDHWKPKSKYPYLCISFFNLQPCCHCCNMHKGDDDEHEYLGLYTDVQEESLDMFRLTIDDADIANYITDHDSSQLDIHFKSVIPRFETVCREMNEQLHIESIYKEHQDVAEEVIWRKMIYNDSFQEALRNLLQERNFTDEEIDRFILGTYFEEKDIHKRPLTKLMQDVFKTCEV